MTRSGDDKMLGMEQITWNDFAKVEFRIGQIVEAVNVEASDKLIRMVVDFGEELGNKIVFSGIRKYYQPEELLNKKTVFVVNMIPKVIMNEKSEAMIFGASDDEKMSILILEKDLANGTQVF
jgi:methionyl-tRNA synthetase